MTSYKFPRWINSFGPARKGAMKRNGIWLFPAEWTKRTSEWWDGILARGENAGHFGPLKRSIKTACADHTGNCNFSHFIIIIIRPWNKNKVMCFPLDFFFKSNGRLKWRARRLDSDFKNELKYVEDDGLMGTYNNNNEKMWPSACGWLNDTTTERVRRMYIGTFFPATRKGVCPVNSYVLDRNGKHGKQKTIDLEGGRNVCVILYWTQCAKGLQQVVVAGP